MTDLRLNVRDTIALAEVVATAEHLGRPDPRALNRMIDRYNRGETGHHEHLVGMAALCLAMLAFFETGGGELEAQHG